MFGLGKLSLDSGAAGWFADETQKQHYERALTSLVNPITRTLGFPLPALTISRGDKPMTFWENGQISVQLDQAELINRWSQTGFQLAHEMCHVAASVGGPPGATTMLEV